jgi:predicted O-methyltransferase YrrM
MTLLKRVVKRLYRIALMPKTRRGIFRLYGESNLSSKSLANALRAALENSVTPEEKAWVDRIESLRKELNSSRTEISIVNYGAGSPDLDLTDEEMYQGRVITRTIGDVCQGDSKPYLWSLLLFKLIREFRPSTCLELGTCLGISTACQAAALKLNQQGRIVTLEGAESLASLARQHFQTLGLNNVGVVVGRFQDTLDKVLNEHGPIDYAFIDGHHDEKATLTYFNQIFPFLSERAVLVFDDISWSSGMKRAWSSLETDERVKISVNLLSLGICIVDSATERKQHFKIPVV